MKKRKNRWKQYFALILFGILTILIYVYEEIQIEQENEEQITYFFEQPIIEKTVSKSENKQIQKESYIAVLEIPTISLKRGLVAINSSLNTIQYNIQIIEPSNMPDVEKGNLILASHNGNSKVSFFKNLSKLREGDDIYLYYNGYRYIYQLSNKYEVDKNGQVEIIRDNNRTTITLITCKNNNKTKQEVYIGYLVDKKKY